MADMYQKIAFFLVIASLFVTFILLLSNSINTDKITTDKEFSSKKEAVIGLLYTKLALTMVSIIAAVYLYTVNSAKVDEMWEKVKYSMKSSSSKYKKIIS